MTLNVFCNIILRISRLMSSERKKKRKTIRGNCSRTLSYIQQTASREPLHRLSRFEAYIQQPLRAIDRAEARFTHLTRGQHIATFRAKMPSDVDSDTDNPLQGGEGSLADEPEKKGPHTPAGTPPPTPALLQQPSDSDDETASLHDEAPPESPPIDDSDNALSAFVGAPGREAYKAGLKALCRVKGLKYKDVRVCLDCCKLYAPEHVRICRHPEQHIQSDVDSDSSGDSASTGPFDENDVGSCDYCNEEHYLSALQCPSFYLRKPCAKCSNIHEYSPVCDNTLPFLYEECHYCGETHKLDPSICEFFSTHTICSKCWEHHEYRGRCYDYENSKDKASKEAEADDIGHCEYCDSEHVLLPEQCGWFSQLKPCAKCDNIHVYSPTCDDTLAILVQACEYCGGIIHKLESTDCEVYIHGEECHKCWSRHEYRPLCDPQSPNRQIAYVDCDFCGGHHQQGLEYCPQFRAGLNCKKCDTAHDYDPLCEVFYADSLLRAAQQPDNRSDTPISNSHKLCDFCKSFHQPAAEFCLRFQQGESCALCLESHSWMLHCPNDPGDDGPPGAIDPELNAAMNEAALRQAELRRISEYQRKWRPNPGRMQLSSRYEPPQSDEPNDPGDDGPPGGVDPELEESLRQAELQRREEWRLSGRAPRIQPGPRHPCDPSESEDDSPSPPVDCPALLQGNVNPLPEDWYGNRSATPPASGVDPLSFQDSDDEPLAKKKHKSASPKKKLKLVASPRRNSSSRTVPIKPDANIAFEKLLLGKFPRKHLTPPRKRSSSPETVRKAPKRKGSPRKSPAKRKRGDSLKKWTAARSAENLSSRRKRHRTPSIVVAETPPKRTRSLSVSALRDVQIRISPNDFAVAEAALAYGGSMLYRTRPVIAVGQRTAANRNNTPTSTRQSRKDKAEGPAKRFNDKIDDTFDPSTVDFKFYKPVERLRGIRTETYLSARELHDRSFWLTKREMVRANELRREMEIELHAKASLIEHPPRYSKYYIKPQQRPYYRSPGDSMDAVGPSGPKLPIPGTTLPKHLLLPEKCIGDAALCALRAGATYYDMRKKFGDKWAEIDNVIPKDWRDIPIGQLEKIEQAKDQKYARKAKPARRSASAPALVPAGIPEIITFTKPKHREHLNGVYIMHIKPVVTHLRAAANLGQVHNAYYKNTGFENDPRYSDAGLLAEPIPADDKIPADIFKVINGQCDDPEIHKKFWAWLDKNWRTAQIPYYRNTPRVFMDSEQNYMYYDETNDWTSIFQCLEEDSAGLKNAVSQVAPGPCCPFPWHREDLDTASFNQAVKEQQKFWYFTNRIDNKRKQQLEEWLYFYEHRDCPAWGRHKLELYDPGWLIQDGIDVYYHRQHSNHFMITHEGSPHCGFSVTAGGATSYNAGFQPWFYYIAPDALREPQCICPSEAKNRELAKAYQKMREWAATIDAIYCRQTFGEELHKFFLRQDGFRQPSWPIDMQLCCFECHLQFSDKDKLSTHRTDYHKKKEKKGKQ